MPKKTLKIECEICGFSDRTYAELQVTGEPNKTAGEIYSGAFRLCSFCSENTTSASRLFCRISGRSNIVEEIIDLGRKLLHSPDEVGYGRGELEKAQREIDADLSKLLPIKSSRMLTNFALLALKRLSLEKGGPISKTVGFHNLRLLFGSERPTRDVPKIFDLHLERLASICPYIELEQKALVPAWLPKALMSDSKNWYDPTRVAITSLEPDRRFKCTVKSGLKKIRAKRSDLLNQAEQACLDLDEMCIHEQLKLYTKSVESSSDEELWLRLLSEHEFSTSKDVAQTLSEFSEAIDSSGTHRLEADRVLRERLLDMNFAKPYKAKRGKKRLVRATDVPPVQISVEQTKQTVQALPVTR